MTRNKNQILEHQPEKDSQHPIINARNLSILTIKKIDIL